MRPYLDTSLLVANFTHEGATHAVQAWFDSQIDVDLMISDWTVTEFSSALGVKVRTRQIDSEQKLGALKVFSMAAVQSFTVLEIERAQFRHAAKIIDSTENLRSGDALHLAVASANNLCLVTLDHRLAAAGPPLGIATQLVPWRN